MVINFAQELESIEELTIKLCKGADAAIDYMKYIKYQETKVIISEK